MAKVPKDLRRALAEAQNWRCAYCATALEVDGPALATAEHIVPSGAGGRKGRLNLVSACLACNGARGADIDAWTFWKLRQRLLNAGLWPAGERPCPEVANLLRTHRAYVRAKIALRRRFTAGPAAATNLLLEDLVHTLNDGCVLTALQITRLRPVGGGCRYQLPRTGRLGLANAERADWDCLWEVRQRVVGQHASAMFVPMDIDLSRLATRVAAEADAYVIPPHPAEALGTPLPDEWYATELAAMKRALVSPAWIEMRDEHAQSRGLVVLRVAVVADDGEGSLVAYDPLADEFVLAQRDADPVATRAIDVVSCGVRGDAVGCFLSR